MDRVERAVNAFGKQGNCAQAILTAFGPDYGLDQATAMGLGRSLGGGMGHLGLVCGAVSAGMLVLGLATDWPADEAQRRAASYEAVQEFSDRFGELRGSIQCRELLGLDLRKPEDLAQARERGLFSSFCPGLVRDAAQLLMDLTAREG